MSSRGLLVMLMLVGCGKVESQAPDSGPDIDAASEDDAGVPEPVSLDQLREIPDGPTNVIVSDVFVTYVRVNGFYLQRQRMGPAIQVFTGPTPPGIEVGSQVTLHVTSLGTFGGNKQIDGHIALDVIPGAADVTELTQDLGLGVVPSEELESELIVVGSVTVASVPAPSTFDVTYVDPAGNTLTTRLFSGDNNPLEACGVGDSFAINQAVVTEFNAVHQIFVGNPGDISPSGPDNCAP